MSAPFKYETDPFAEPSATQSPSGHVRTRFEATSQSSAGPQGALMAPGQVLALAQALLNAGYPESAIAAAEVDGSPEALACVEAWSRLATADAAFAPLVARSRAPLVPSVQLESDGSARFVLTSHDPEALASACRLEHGPHGIQAELRMFLDDALCVGDVFLDLAPGLGFAALGAATSGHDVTVVTAVDNLSAAGPLRESARLSGCAERVIVTTTDQVESIAISHIRGAGLVMLHLGDAGDVAHRVQAVLALHRSERIGAVAWRCGPSDGEIEGVATAAAALGALDLSHFALAWRDGRSELVPADVAASNEYIFSISRAMIARSDH